MGSGVKQALTRDRYGGGRDDEEGDSRQAFQHPGGGDVWAESVIHAKGLSRANATSLTTRRVRFLKNPASDFGFRHPTGGKNCPGPQFGIVIGHRRRVVTTPYRDIGTTGAELNAKINILAAARGRGSFCRRKTAQLRSTPRPLRIILVLIPLLVLPPLPGSDTKPMDAPRPPDERERVGGRGVPIPEVAPGVSTVFRHAPELTLSATQSRTPSCSSVGHPRPRFTPAFRRAPLTGRLQGGCRARKRANPP